ncbi:glycosyltransferase family 8 protein [Wenxinia saemankumensis]|uniref:Lipopolysaccharide biosynthesis protein, LPS:glycosyltransferase n=1 Tax=Wenxinia saemankumensis TaxID=1447782 RepID=A0A1M6HZG6_9RHOB|nr:glycosyltransferase family 8 protein [Wenxinia saemankumensis]SHJ27622.1 Lipopolysaccharide biosynthesis protein, LPS:glycosyltransferase [Wenxinia saemankumensis]
MHVLFCADSGYFPHLATAAVSVLENCSWPGVHVHVLTCDADDAAEAGLRESLQRYPAARLTLTRVDDARLETLFVDKYLTKAAYLRFLAPDLLPLRVARVIYLDCDLVVPGDLAELWRTDLAGTPLAAAPDLDWWHGGLEPRLIDLGLRSGHRYVNSGVLVIDLDQWRREGISDRLFRFAATSGAALVYHDQDALNVVLQGRVALLERRWNIQTLWYSHFVRRTFPAEYAATRAARARPAIVHFSTDQKPWKFRAWTRKRALYFRYRSLTAWRAERPAGLTAAQRLEYDLSRALLRVGIDVNAAFGAARRLRRIGASAIARRAPSPPPAPAEPDRT